MQHHTPRVLNILMTVLVALLFVFGCDDEKSTVQMTDDMEVRNLTSVIQIDPGSQSGNAPSLRKGYAVDSCDDAFIVGMQNISGLYSDRVEIFSRNGTSLKVLSAPSNPAGWTIQGFGRAVAISDTYAVVGAYGSDSSAGADRGLVFIYKKSSTTGWAGAALKAILYGAVNGALFGYAVDVDGTDVIIGAHLGSQPGVTAAGSAYIYRTPNGTTWALAATLSPPILKSQASAGFGVSVAVDGGVAVVGAYSYDLPSKANAGAAYVYKYNGTWPAIPTSTLSPGSSLMYANGFFGRDVDVSEDLVIVGAHRASSNRGRAYLFRQNGSSWPYEAQLSDSNQELQSYDYFGYSVSVDTNEWGDFAVVGAYQYDPGTSDSNAGTALLYKRTGNNWTEEHRFVPVSPFYPGARFGISVSINGDKAIVGAYMEQVGLYQQQGRSYIFDWDMCSYMGTPACPDTPQNREWIPS